SIGLGRTSQRASLPGEPDLPWPSCRSRAFVFPPLALQHLPQHADDADSVSFDSVVVPAKYHRTHVRYLFAPSAEMPLNPRLSARGFFRMVTEAVVRDSLRQELLARRPELSETYYEFWVPRTNERADVAALGSSLWGFEIKTDRDTLSRLPRQVEAYSRLF